jgi:DnaJ-class molecular chaperone
VKDYYKILGLLRSADVSEIRKAYRENALEQHPDKNNNPNSTQIFIELNEAYNVLKHASSKVRYDKLYDHHILGKKPKNTSRYYQKENTRSQFVKNRAERGRKKARTYSKQTSNQFRKKARRARFWDPFSIIFNLIGEILLSFG